MDNPVHRIKRCLTALPSSAGACKADLTHLKNRKVLLCGGLICVPVSADTVQSTLPCLREKDTVAAPRIYKE